MQLLVDGDPTSLSYWLNWRVLLCAVWVLTSMIVAILLIWKYERSEDLESDGETSRIPRYDDLWKPCVKEIHPIFMMAFRIIAFCLLLVALIIDVSVHGFELFLYYTQWTFTLATIYFGLGSLISMHGCYHYLQRNSTKYHLPTDVEHGLDVPLAHGKNGNGIRLSGISSYLGKSHDLPNHRFWGFLFQVLYQMTAGAVTITDVVYWGVIFPFMTLRDYEMNLLTVVTHSLNAIFLLGDTALNRLPFPAFRISYFILLTGVYVIFQWVFHACVSTWWPYPFLDLSLPYSPLWYLIVALMHLPCYAFYMLIVKVKQMALSRWCSDSLWVE
ncbi:uncharacterized protein LOC127241850 [Andrographis paniculata]|uniref:uncharacterized protein LOC127241850 n=1 Tax=Andrographis paniculata TaxID=175694 RepID=UPI0021E76E19|nr:uncharacterized protein LOC127241850 [Andrographis paniculata]